MRTVASYLGHESVSMTLDTYADVDMAAAPPIECDLFDNGPASQLQASPSRWGSSRPYSPRPGPSREARRKVTDRDLGRRTP